jgi:hypothetical protein
MANTIYTLRGENVGPLAHLNGKMFTIEFDSEGHMTLNDVTAGNWLRKTTRIVKAEETINGVVYTTASGAVYDLVNVETLLPSSPLNPLNQIATEPFKVDLSDIIKDFPIGDSELPKIEAIPIPVEIQEEAAKIAEEAIKEADTKEAINIDDIPAVVEEYNVNRAIYYGDGYYGVVFSFVAEVNYEQFIRFCKAKGMKVPREKGYAWYEDHPMVFNHKIIDGERHPNKGASEKDTSFVWTWLWVRAYTD